MGANLKDKERRVDVRREGDKQLPVADVRRLAWFAESADGQRGEHMVLYRRNGKVYLGSESEAAERKGKAILRVTLPRHSRGRFSQRPPLDRVPQEVDAIFLSDSAVEKFLFPYYEAQRLFVPGELERLKSAFYGHNEPYVGILHVQPSRPLLLKADGTWDEFKVQTVVDLE